MSQYGFGRSVRRLEDARLLMGHGRYTADIDLPGQAYAHVVRASYAHAEVRAVGVARARAAPGVLAVLTARDLDADGLGPLAGWETVKNADGGAPFTPDRPLLAGDRVRYAGEPLALVVADTRDAAEDGAELVDVDYRDLAAVTDTGAAMAADAPRLWDEAPDNVAMDWASGDRDATARAFSEAAHVTRLNLVNNRVIGMPMEPVAAVGVYEPADGRYRLYTPTQGVHRFRDQIAAEVLKIPARNLDVISPDVGGGFGVRIRPIPEQVLVLWAARRVGRPVKWVAPRTEAMVADVHARDHVTEAELALDGDGRFLAIRVSVTAAMGAYVSTNGRTSPTEGFATAIPSVYKTPAFHVRVCGVFTNTAPTNAYRGAGRPEAIYVVERLIDTAAAELGLSPVELRNRNLVPADAMPYRAPSGDVYDSGDFPRMLRDALAAADADGFPARCREARARGRRRGLGISVYMKINGGPPGELAEVRFDEGGGVTVLIGSQSNGQGHETALAQMVCGRLGIPIESVRVVQGDTTRVANGHGTGGSSLLSVDGIALRDAIERVVEAGKRIAGHALEAAEADIDFADGRYVVAGTDRTLDMAEVALMSFEAGPGAAGTGAGLAERACFAKDANTYTNGCHVSEVEVDIDTGKVDLVSHTVVDDLGRVLNPMMAAGQIQGGLVQGLGQALCELTAYDPDSGQLLTGSFMDYCLPRAGDVPDLDVRFVEIPCTTNPLGVKGAGEAGTTGAPPAVVNAVVDALREFGVRHIDMPLTPLRVWRAIHARDGG